jgi:hypothetical protein
LDSLAITTVMAPPAPNNPTAPPQLTNASTSSVRRNLFSSHLSRRPATGATQPSTMDLESVPPTSQPQPGPESPSHAIYHNAITNDKKIMGDDIILRDNHGRPFLPTIPPTTSPSLTPKFRAARSRRGRSGLHVTARARGRHAREGGQGTHREEPSRDDVSKSESSAWPRDPARRGRECRAEQLTRTRERGTTGSGAGKPEKEGRKPGRGPVDV